MIANGRVLIFLSVCKIIITLHSSNIDPCACQTRNARLSSGLCMGFARERCNFTLVRLNEIPLAISGLKVSSEKHFQHVVLTR